MVADIRNLMRQHALLLKSLEVAEAMRVYIAQHMDGSENFCSKLKLVENELSATRKAIKEVVGLLKNVENERKVAKAKARRLRDREKRQKLSSRKPSKRTSNRGRRWRSSERGLLLRKKN